MALLPFRREGQLSLSDLQEQMNMLLSRVWHGGVSTGPFDGQDWAPPLDVHEAADRYVVKAELPGLRVENIDVSYDGHTLTIAGEKVVEPADEAVRSTLCRERRFGSFRRSVDLPGGVESSGVTAICRNGILEVTLPKDETCRATTIRIDVED
jgi:HSP20 family protein